MRQNSQSTSDPTSPSAGGGAAGGEAAGASASSPGSGVTPEPGRKDRDGTAGPTSDKDKRKSVASDKSDEEEVEALSEMMCSLVTNQWGETRYMGEYSLFPYFMFSFFWRFIYLLESTELVVLSFWFRACGFELVVSILWFRACGLKVVVKSLWFRACGIKVVVLSLWFGSWLELVVNNSLVGRLLVWVLHLLAEGHSVGQREDWRYHVPGDDLGGFGRRPQVD